jgi:hypothetical protein
VAKKKFVGWAHPNFIIKSFRELCQERGYNFESNPRDFNGRSEWSTVAMHVETEEFEAGFEVAQHPGCCAILDMSYIKVHPFNKTTFDAVVQLAEQAAYDAGFGAIMLTQVVPAFSKMLWKDEPWIKCLDRGWMAAPVFRNAKSGNLVTIITKDLGQKEKKEGLEQALYD